MTMTAVAEPMNSSPSPRTEKNAEQPAMNRADMPSSNLKNHEEVCDAVVAGPIDASPCMENLRTQKGLKNGRAGIG